jgi:DUF4097 and DUF4098 domain-containing protein YvlB
MRARASTLSALATVIVVAGVAHGALLKEYRFASTRTFEVGADPSVTVEAITGDVSYTGVEGTSAEVVVSVLIKAHDSTEAEEIYKNLHIIAEGSEGMLDVRLDDTRDFYRWLRDNFSTHHEAEVSFKVHGPRGADLQLSSVSGDTRAEEIKGIVKASSVSGDVFVADAEGKVKAHSTSGSVEVRRGGGPVIVSSVSGDVTVVSCGGTLDVESTSGAVRVSNVTGSTVAETVSGDVEVRGAGDNVDASSTSGDISVEQEKGGVKASSTSGDVSVRSHAGGDMDIETVSGEVKLSVNPDSYGDVSLSTSSGSIDSAVPIKVRRHSERRLEGQLGAGASTMHVSTHSGDITLAEY